MRIKNKMILYGGIVGIFNTLIRGYELHQYLVFSNMQCVSLYGFFIMTIGYLNVDEIKYIFPLLLFLLQHIVLIYLLGDRVSSALSNTASMVFTRSNNRVKWIVKEYVYIATMIFVYYITMITMALLIAIIMFGNVEYSMVWYTIKLVLTNILFSVLILFSVNVLSLYHNVMYSVMIVLGFIVANAMAISWCYQFQEELFDYFKMSILPLGVYCLWSDVKLPVWYTFEDNISFVGSAYTHGIVATVILIIIICYIGVKKINKMDIW